MPLDYNLWNVIKQGSLYDKKVQGAKDNMLYQQKLHDRAAEQSAEQLKMQQSTELFIDEIQKSFSQFETQDINRIKQVEKQARDVVYQSVKDAGGDMKRFFMTGGHKMLREYRDSIGNSKELSNAINNKSVIAQMSKDIAEGKLLKNVTIKGKKGQEEFISLDGKEALALFNSGDIERINYGGAEEIPELDMDYFQKHWSAKDPYGTNNKVTLDDLKAYYMAKNLSKEGADKIVPNFAQGLNEQGEQVTGFFWGAKDMDFGGISKLYGITNGYNTTTKSGYTGKFQKNGQKVNAIFQEYYNPSGVMTVHGSEIQSDWTRKDGTIEPKLIQEVNAPSALIRPVLNVLGIGMDDEGNILQNQYANELFVDPVSGQNINLKPSDYKMVNINPNRVTVVRDGTDASKDQFF